MGCGAADDLGRSEPLDPFAILILGAVEALSGRREGVIHKFVSALPAKVHDPLPLGSGELFFALPESGGGLALVAADGRRSGRRQGRQAQLAQPAHLAHVAAERAGILVVVSAAGALPAGQRSARGFGLCERRGGGDGGGCCSGWRSGGGGVFGRYLAGRLRVKKGGMMAAIIVHKLNG